MFLKTSLATILYCTFSFLSAQVTSVSYLLEYNNSTCEYDFSIITAGDATTNAQRFQFNSQITFLTKAGSSLSITDRYQPMTITNPVQPNNWNINVIAEAPTEDPLHNYYTIGPALSPTSRYPVLADGDTTTLFSVIASPEIYGDGGLRLLDPDSDPTNIMNSDFSHGFTLGGLDPLYIGNALQVYPAEVGNIDGPSTILVGETTTLSPGFTTAWTSTNTSVATVDFTGVVTGISAGTCTLEYEPTSGCSSAVEVTVVDAGTLTNDRVGVGTPTPDLSAILDIVSTDKGLLLPRLTSAQRVQIPSPAEGLVVYQTSNPQGVYINTNSGWQKLSTEAVTQNTVQDNDTNTQSLRSSATTNECAELKIEIDALKASLLELKQQLGTNR